MRALFFAFVFLAAGPAFAEGISWSVGLGAGGSSFSPAILGAGAGALSGRVTYSLDNRLAVGGELFLMGQYNRWEAYQPVASSLSSLMAEVTFRDNHPWYVAGGLGWGSGLKIDRDRDVQTLTGPVSNVEPTGGNGVSWLAAFGWTFKPGPVVDVELRYDGAALNRGLGDVHTVMVMGRIGK